MAVGARSRGSLMCRRGGGFVKSMAKLPLSDAELTVLGVFERNGLVANIRQI